MRQPMHVRHPCRRAFSLIELIVVIGIIAILLGLLFPALHSVRANAMSIKCQSNMRQIGMAMLMYANDNRGQLFPFDAGGPTGMPPIDHQWFIYVLKPTPPRDTTSTEPRDWTPPTMLCPADFEDPAWYHSYILNDHLNEHGIKYTSKNIPNHTADTVVVLGEKVTTVNDYYVQAIPGEGSDFDTTIEFYRHGLRLKSNYLYLDLHVDHNPQKLIGNVLDPWDLDMPARENPTQ